MTARTLTSSAVSQDSTGASPSLARSTLWRLAWRNLWRNRRRTWLTAGGIAFACLLVGASMALQAGSYAMMIKTATGFLSGQIQISSAAYVRDEKLEQTIVEATSLMRLLSTDQSIAIAPRAHAYALISADERSFGGLLSGVDFAAELEVGTFFKRVTTGTLPQSDDELLLGSIMARNLAVEPGDEVVLLGSAKEGGIAALALTVSGIFASGQAEIDRTMLFGRLSAVQNAFALGDEVHQLVIATEDLDSVEVKVAELTDKVRATRGQDTDLVVRSWPAFLPDLVQAIELDRISGRLVYGAILILVSFSVINTFVMIVFERTREFGMLLSIGMRAGLIMRQILTEAFCMWLVGVALGTVLMVATVSALISIGIPIAGMEELANTFYMEDRIYPAFSLVSLIAAPLVLLLGTQLAGLLATLRIRRLRPVTAMRAE